MYLSLPPEAFNAAPFMDVVFTLKHAYRVNEGFLIRPYIVNI